MTAKASRAPMIMALAVRARGRDAPQLRAKFLACLNEENGKYPAAALVWSLEASRQLADGIDVLSVAVFVDTENGKFVAAHTDRHPTADSSLLIPLAGHHLHAASDPLRGSRTAAT